LLVPVSTNVTNSTYSHPSAAGRWNYQDVLVERKRRRSAGQCRQGILPDEPAERESDRHLSDELVALDESCVLDAALALLEFQVVVRESR
jgi:hypothetical protein